MKKYYLYIVFTLFIVFCRINHPEFNFTSIPNNYFVNQHNRGFICKYDSILYYAAYDGIDFYKNSSKTTILDSIYMVKCLSYFEKSLYFYCHINNFKGISSYSSDKDSLTLITPCDTDLFLHNGYIYYGIRAKDSLFSLDLRTNEKKLFLPTRCSFMNFRDSLLYYCKGWNNGRIYRRNLNTGSEEKLLDCAAANLILKDNFLIYKNVSKNNTLWIYNLNSKENKMLVSNRIRSYTILDNWIFYADSKYIKCINLVSGRKYKIIEQYPDQRYSDISLYITDNALFVFSNSGMDKMCLKTLRYLKFDN